MDPLPVAIDVGPLHGHRTGVGLAVADLVGALARRDDVRLVPYVVSSRARPVPPQRRLPLPAFAAVELWGHTDHPRADRWLDGARVVHGTNYVVPPTRSTALVSVYDCWFLRHPDQASPAVRRAGRVLRRAIRRGAHVHASSHATADAVRSLLATDDVHVVPLGAPPRPLDDGAPLPAGLDGRPLVAAIGTVERRKDLPTLVRAFARLVDRAPDVHLVIAGAPGDDQARLDATIAASSPAARGRIHVLGPIDDSTKGRLLTRSSVFAYPSLDEGFGFPILEAQAACVPVVARRAGSIGEVGGGGVALVDASTHDELVEAFADELHAVLHDGARRLDLVEAGVRNVTRFDWSSTAAAMAGLYHRLADAAPTAPGGARSAR
jgi:glycosyltransferase involved in cell wall biosynthesis